jgi:hypothetical protein
MLNDINSTYQTRYYQVSKRVHVTSLNSFVALSMIINENVFGREYHAKIIDNDNKNGRPILMILTEKNNTVMQNRDTTTDTHYNLLICLHGDQKPKEGQNMENFNSFITKLNKESLQNKVIEYLREKQQKVNNIFVMGDFNDRYDAIKDLNFGEYGKVSYVGESPYSCCHNWDSSCGENRYQSFPDGDRESKTQYGYCNVDKKLTETTVNVTTSECSTGEKKIKLPITDEGAYIENYRYKGDKVLGNSPVDEMQMYGLKEKQISQESDHELVFAAFTLNESPPVPELAPEVVAPEVVAPEVVAPEVISSEVAPEVAPEVVENLPRYTATPPPYEPFTSEEIIGSGGKAPDRDPFADDVVQNASPPYFVEDPFAEQSNEPQSNEPQQLQQSNEPQMLTSQVDEFDENDAQEYSQDNGIGKFITSSSNPNILKVIPNEGEPYYHNTVNDLTSYNYEDVLFVNPFDQYGDDVNVETGGKRKRKRKTMKKKRNTRKKMNKKRKTKNKPKKALKRATRKGRRKH